MRNITLNIVETIGWSLNRIDPIVRKMTALLRLNQLKENENEN